MNTDMLSSAQHDRLNQLIDVLLQENACLKQAVAALLPGGKGLSDAEIAFVKALAGNSESGNSYHQPLAGNNEMNISNDRLAPGNIGIDISNQQPMDGNYRLQNSNQQVMIGNKAADISSHHLMEGITEQQLAIVQENVRNLMKKAILSSHVATARILAQLSLNPATPLSALRNLTGLSFDGMAKRIMAMKKAGLIVRLPAPKRYLLTEKAKELFIKKWR